jgi:protein-disulfide isomerase
MKWLAIGLVGVAMWGAVQEQPKSKTAGNPGAPLQLVLYEDFTCPHCKMVHEQFVPMLVNEYVTTGKAYLVFRDYVLSGPGHEQSRPAATWAAAAARIGRYQTAADALFRTQNSWAMSGQIWPAISSAFTPDEQKKIQQFYKDPATAAMVQADIDQGNTVPITQTPTLLITAKGKKQPWTMWNSYPLLKSYLDSLLR